MSKVAGLPIVGQMFDRVPASLREVRERAHARAIPFHAQIYLEHRCNLKCQHCFEDESTHPTDNQLGTDEVKRVLDDLAALGTLQLTLTGGEIFLRRDLLEIVAYAKKKRFYTTLFTSGYFIDRAKAQALSDAGVGQVDISVYTDVAADHDAFTQIPGSHKRSTDALRFLTEIGVGAALKCVLMTFNVDRIDDIMRLAHDIGVPFQFDPNVRPRMSNDRSTLRFALSPEQLRDKVYSRRDLYPGFQRIAPDRICRGNDFQDGDAAMCGAGSSTLAVQATGDVLPCGFFPHAVGNVRDKSLKEIWETSGLLQDMRQMTFAKMSTCPSCELRSGCHPCMAYAQVEGGDYTGCNTASKESARAILLLSERGARAAAKIERAEKQRRRGALPIVGDTHLPDVDGRAASALAMFD